jgi:hypothetical protein
MVAGLEQTEEYGVETGCAACGEQNRLWTGSVEEFCESHTGLQEQ